MVAVKIYAFSPVRSLFCISDEQLSTFNRLFRKISPQHSRALVWFWERRDQEIPWPKPLTPDLLLMSKAKGIYEPKWTPYALSVRNSLAGPYADGEPVYAPDGSWTYDYFQEGADPAKRDEDYTNVGMLACLRDQVPIAVLRQTKGKPNSRYQVLGLALVKSWKDGYFLLQGFTPDGALPDETTGIVAADSAGLAAEGEAFLDQATALISPLKGGTTPSSSFSGQGWGLTADERTLVEMQAMGKALEWLEANGFVASDVSRSTTASCDFKAMRDGQEWVVEVKGTTGAAASILLTPNEVNLHLKAYPLNALIVVHGISLSADRRAASGGELMVLAPWRLEPERLTGITYQYRLGGA